MENAICGKVQSSENYEIYPDVIGLVKKKILRYRVVRESAKKEIVDQMLKRVLVGLPFGNTTLDKVKTLGYLVG